MRRTVRLGLIGSAVMMAIAAAGWLLFRGDDAAGWTVLVSTPASAPGAASATNHAPGAGPHAGTVAIAPSGAGTSEGRGEAGERLRDLLQPAIEQAAASVLPEPEARSAFARSIAIYLGASGATDFDTMASNQSSYGAVPERERVMTMRGVLRGMPERVRPEGWQTWSDLDVLRYGVRNHRGWGAVRLGSIVVSEADRDGSGAVDYYRELPRDQRDGVFSTPLFEIADLHERLTPDGPRVLTMTLEVSNTLGMRYRLRIWCAELQPGRWFTHRTLLLGPMSSDGPGGIY